MANVEPIWSIWYLVLTDGESDRHQALPAVGHHAQVFGHAPLLVTGDPGVHTKGVEEQAQALGVRHIVIPRCGPTTSEQRAREHSRVCHRRYRWRAAIEGRIINLRRQYGLARCAYHGEVGLQRWLGCAPWQPGACSASMSRHTGQSLAIAEWPLHCDGKGSSSMASMSSGSWVNSV